MKTRLNVATSNGFIYVNGKLMDFKFVSAMLNFENGSVEYTCKLGGEDKTFTTDQYLEVYANENDFRNGDFIQSEEVRWEDVLKRAFDCYNLEDNGDNTYAMYSIINNKVERVIAPVTDFIMYSNGKQCYTGEGKFYSTHDHAQLYCDVVMVDENGTETISHSPAKRVALNDEQNKAVEEIKLSIEKAKKLGVVLLVDVNNDSLYAYSRKQVKTIDYDCSTKTFTKYGTRINDLCTPVGEDVWGLSMDDTSIYVEFE